MLRLKINPEPKARGNTVATAGNEKGNGKGNGAGAGSGPGSGPGTVSSTGPGSSTGTSTGIVKTKIRVKARKPGDGYDSEAPDRETDPMIEEALILRMLPGPGLELLRKAVEEGDMSQVSVKFSDARTATVKVNDQAYGAKLVDLPTVTEAHKTFDRKNMYKTADICQMLLVTHEINGEAPVSVPVEHPHGLATPLWNVRRRRFRKRVSNKIIETVEAKVDELFRKDELAAETQYELLTPAQLQRQPSYSTPGNAVASFGREAAASALNSTAPTPAHDSDDGSPFDMLGEAEDEVDMEKELEMALAEGSDNEDRDEDDDEDDDDDDADDGDDADDDEDDDRRVARQKNELIKSRILELETTIRTKKDDAEKAVNQILKGRILDVIGKLTQELEMEKRQLQPEDDKDDKDMDEDKDMEDDKDMEADDDDKDMDVDDEVDQLFM